jgi:hypothetical protein
MNESVLSMEDSRISSAHTAGRYSRELVDLKNVMQEAIRS